MSERIVAVRSRRAATSVANASTRSATGDIPLVKGMSEKQGCSGARKTSGLPFGSTDSWTVTKIQHPETVGKKYATRYGYLARNCILGPHGSRNMNPL